MRIFSKTLAIGGFLALIISGVSSGNVSAASTCPIGYTGPDSTNICTSVETYACTVANDNQVTVDNQNAQGSVSGDVGGNGSQSGTATNTNGAVFNITVTNEGVCTAVRTATPTPTATPQPTSTPTAQSTPRVVAVAEAPTELADTGNEFMSWLPFVGLAVLTGGALAVRYAFVRVK